LTGTLNPPERIFPRPQGKDKAKNHTKEAIVVDVSKAQRVSDIGLLAIA